MQYAYNIANDCDQSSIAPPWPKLISPSSEQKQQNSIGSKLEDFKVCRTVELTASYVSIGSVERGENEAGVVASNLLLLV